MDSKRMFTGVNWNLLGSLDDLARGSSDWSPEHSNGLELRSSEGEPKHRPLGKPWICRIGRKNDSTLEILVDFLRKSEIFCHTHRLNWLETRRSRALFTSHTHSAKAFLHSDSAKPISWKLGRLLGSYGEIHWLNQRWGLPACTYFNFTR